MANCRVVVTDLDKVQGIVDAGLTACLQPLSVDGEGVVLVGTVYTVDQVAAIKAAPGFISMKPDNPVRLR